ncbi:hypothetical protein GCM10018980_74250 [Streptomyces capoamus]|uniref:Uncharacterized protein n=1 Tax=Streptomyces capoamus TaxID=68183 RepID=A0A919KGA2_9ACTN|nr:hypothetical protein GCM10018980_74250 [Streptomyces capoamus]
MGDGVDLGVLVGGADTGDGHAAELGKRFELVGAVAGELAGIGEELSDFRLGGLLAGVGVAEGYQRITG